MSRSAPKVPLELVDQPSYHRTRSMMRSICQTRKIGFLTSGKRDKHASSENENHPDSIRLGGFGPLYLSQQLCRSFRNQRSSTLVLFQSLACRWGPCHAPIVIISIIQVALMLRKHQSQYNCILIDLQISTVRG